MTEILDLIKAFVPIIAIAGGGVWVEKLRGEIAAQADRCERDIQTTRELARSEANRVYVDLERRDDELRSAIQRVETSLSTLREAHARTVQIAEDTHAKSSKLFQEVSTIRNATHEIDKEIGRVLAEVEVALSRSDSRSRS